jgi:Cellulase (glycosyl hydrolase family 5)
VGRNVSFIVFVCLVAAAAPAAALAAARMPIGFQDDAAFRWSNDAPAQLDLAQQAHASIIRTVVDWYQVAPRQPANPADSFDAAYNFNDLDALVQNAAARNIRLLLTIWGTPRWANGGRTPNYAPTRLADLTQFARALADRYSGRHPGLPYVGRYSVWNEPNLGIFLSPEFGEKGQIVGPGIYAGLYRAAYAGIKVGNPMALVAIGETSNQGRDHRLTGAPVSVAPGTFARLLALQKGLRFDAYAEHPYATRPNLPPNERVNWPNVTLGMLPRFEQSLDLWFHRQVPVWITEYAYQTTPAARFGVTPTQQAAYLTQALRTLRVDPNVQMFIWFVFRDSATATWKSGLFTQSGTSKPAYGTFTALAASIDGETQTVQAGVAPLLALPVPRLAYISSAGEPIGITYRIYYRGNLVALGQPQENLGMDGEVRFVADFKPVAGNSYTVVADANDIHGDDVVRTFMLVPPTTTQVRTSATGAHSTRR